MVTRVTWKTLETIIKTKLKEGVCSGVLLTKGASRNNSHYTETNSIARLETWGMESGVLVMKGFISD